MDAAVGMIEVEGVAGIVVGADAACKAAGVRLLGWESTGGFTTVFFEGPLSSVEAALRSGEAAAREVAGRVAVALLTQPEPACRRYITFPVPEDAPVQPGALGLVEARGYGIHVFASDQMVKAADVAVCNVLTVQNRVVCTLLQGEVGAVREAVAVGRSLVSEGKHLMCSAVIPQPVPDVLRAFACRAGA